MKKSILFGCLVLGLVGCTTERGGVGTTYDTTYGAGASTSIRTRESIYPLYRQPSITGDDMGSVRPLIDPWRDYGWDYQVSEPTVYQREYPARASAPRDPFVR